MCNNQYLSFLFIYILFQTTNCLFFKAKKMNVNLKETLKEINQKEKLGDSNDCLISESEARIILKEKYNINPDYIDIDQNIRFILGKCNPVIYVPGLYASRMVATINCPVFKKDFLHFVKMRLFCGETVCGNEENTYEEYVIFPAIFDSPFQIRVSEGVNKYTACQGYFYSFYNSRTECPENNCEYSDGVRISYYGGTKKTKNESRCGIKALEDIIYASNLLPAYITNRLTAANFYVIIQDYRKMGIKDGFAAAGISFDYRRYISSNKFFEASFEYEINRLYRNTGKPVVLISHSLGGLLILNQLIKISPELKKKIKAFVPIVPPFAGASHLLEAYLYGLSDFNTEINILDITKIVVIMSYFSESLYFSPAPIVAELRPQDGVLRALQKPEYAKLKLALEELINVEKECWDKNCPKEKVKEMTKNLYEVFGDDFPSLGDEDCQLDQEELLNIKNSKGKDKLTGTFTRRCITNLYNIFNCPFLLYEKDFGTDNVSAEQIKDLCGTFNSSLLYLTGTETSKPKTYKEIFEINNKSKLNNAKENKKTHLDTLFENHAKYPYNYNEFYELLDEYNSKYAARYNKTLTKDDFETEEEFQKKGKRNVEFVQNNSLIQDLPIPTVDTYICYTNYHTTDISFVYDNSKKDKPRFDGNENLVTSGDGTVPNFSNMLTGMKWIYEKKMNNLPQEIKLIEYCSLASNKGNKYGYDKSTFKNKTFIGLGCDCLNSDYKSFNGNDCTHAAIPQDSYLIDMIKQELIFDENNLNDFSEDKRNAIKRYNKSIDYEQTCNDALYFFNRDDMDPIDWF